MIQRYDEADGIDYESGEIACSGKGKYVLYADHLAEVQRLLEIVSDADHLCKWLLQSDISDDDRERVTRENGINFAAALQAESKP